jgi:autoinducer 2 (AI-2) kinase
MKNGLYVMNIDIGTGSGRAIIFDCNGRQLAVSQREWFPSADPNYPGAFDFDTASAWASLAASIRDAIAKAGIKAQSIRAVTATAMREGMVLYDRQGKEIWACPNADARGIDEAAAMVKQGLAEKIYEIGGDWLSIISPPRFLWIKRHKPDLYNRIAKMSMLSDWALYRLSGVIMTEPSIGSSSGLFDLTARKWSSVLLRELELLETIFPPVCESGTIIGAVTDKASGETGLASGTPVVSGGADTQMALVGAGAVQSGTYVVCGGTFWQTAVTWDVPLIDPRREPRTLCHAVPGLWMTEGIGFYHGFTMRWFRDGFCQEEIKKAAACGSDPYSEMEALAAATPAGANGVNAIFSNIMNARSWRHAPPSFVGFDILRAAGTGKAACIRAIEENAAYVTRGHLAIIERLTKTPARELTFVGGAAKGSLWPQIVADVTNCRVRIPAKKETTSLGGAVAALVGIGEFKGWRSGVDSVVRYDFLREPDQSNVEKYSELFERWKKVYERVLSLADDRILPGLWRAPGV